MQAGAPHSGARFGRLTLHWPALAIYSALTFVMLFPLFRVFGSATIGAEYDNLFFVRQVWWMAHAVLDLKHSPLFDPTSYYPNGYELGRGPYAPGVTIPAIPLTRVLGPIFTHNLLVVASFVLSALTTYAWIWRLTRNRWAAFVAGLIFAFLPYRFARTIHLELVTTQWMPLTLWGFEGWLQKPSKARALGVGIGGALIALADWYYAYSAALLLPLYGILRFRQSQRRLDREVLVHAGLAGAAMGVLVFPFLMDSVRLTERGIIGGRALGILKLFTLNPYDPFVPNLHQPVWGEALKPYFLGQYGFWLERSVVLGYTALALAVFCIAKYRRAPAVIPMLAVWLAAYAISLGPTLNWRDHEVTIPLTTGLARQVHDLLATSPALAEESARVLERSAVPVPLPALFLYLFVPFTSGMRVMARFGIWTALMTAGLAGLGLAALLDRLKRAEWPSARVPVLIAGVSALVLFESWSDVPIFELRPRAVDLWLRQQSDSTVIVEIPAKQNVRALQDYYKTVHQRNTVFGPIGDSYPPADRFTRPGAIANFPAAESLTAMRAWGVTHILITPDDNWPAMKRALEGEPAVRYLAAFDGVQVYRLNPERGPGSSY